MSHRLFRRLRRSRALFALAVCAWLALASVASARADEGCAPMMAAMGMSMHHGALPEQGHPPHATLAPDGCCAHGAASVPPAAVPRVQFVHANTLAWQSRREVAPQPVYEPPLRPPVA